MRCLTPLLLAVALPLSATEDFASKAAALEGKKDAKAWLALAEWAGDRLLFEEREKALKAVLAFDPENAKAHDRLDEKKWDGAWMPAAEAEAKEIEAQEAKGLAFYGAKWMPQKEADKLIGADARSIHLAARNRIDTPHLKVYGKCDLATALKVAWTLERGAEAWRRFHEGVWTLKPKMKEVEVVLFKNPEDFRLHQKKLLELRLIEKESPPEEFTTSFTTSGCLLVYLDGVAKDEHACFRTVLPGAVSQVATALDMRLAGIDDAKQMPPWVQVGHGYLFGYGTKGRRVYPGAAGDFCDDGVLYQLENGLASLSLKALLSITLLDDFQKTDGPFRLAESWAFTRFLLLADDGKRAKGFRKYLSGLPGKGSVKDFEREVAKVSDLEAPFKAWVETSLPKK